MLAVAGVVAMALIVDHIGIRIDVPLLVSTTVEGDSSDGLAVGTGPLFGVAVALLAVALAVGLYGTDPGGSENDGLEHPARVLQGR